MNRLSSTTIKTNSIWWSSSSLRKCQLWTLILYTLILWKTSTSIKHKTLDFPWSNIRFLNLSATSDPKAPSLLDVKAPYMKQNLIKLIRMILSTKWVTLSIGLQVLCFLRIWRISWRLKIKCKLIKMIILGLNKNMISYWKNAFA